MTWFCHMCCEEWPENYCEFCGSMRLERVSDRGPEAHNPASTASPGPQSETEATT